MDPHTTDRDLFSVDLLFWRCVISHLLWTVNSAVLKTNRLANINAYLAIWSAESGSGYWSSWNYPSSPPPPAFPCLPSSLWSDCQLKMHNVTLILVQAQRRGEEHSWWKCSEQGNDDGWRTNLSLLLTGSVIVWQRLLCRSLSLSFMNLQVAHRLKEFFGCQLKSHWKALNVDMKRCLFLF